MDGREESGTRWKFRKGNPSEDWDRVTKTGKRITGKRAEIRGGVEGVRKNPSIGDLETTRYTSDKNFSIAKRWGRG